MSIAYWLPGCHTTHNTLTAARRYKARQPMYTIKSRSTFPGMCCTEHKDGCYTLTAVNARLTAAQTRVVWMAANSVADNPIICPCDTNASIRTGTGGRAAGRLQTALQQHRGSNHARLPCQPAQARPAQHTATSASQSVKADCHGKTRQACWAAHQLQQIAAGCTAVTLATVTTRINWAKDSPLRTTATKLRQCYQLVLPTPAATAAA
jgi:hypothetical protein